MATVTHGVANTPATTNVSSYATTAGFTPAAGDLLVAFVVVSDSVAVQTTLTGTLGMTFAQVARATYRTSLDSVYAFVSEQFAVASSQNVTWTTGDAATGCIIYVTRIAGMSRTALDAIRQSKVASNQAIGTPTVVFDNVALTGNVCLGAVGNSTSPATLTPPTNFTEGVTDLGYATPTTGAEYAFRNSGHTSATITWGSSSASAFGALTLELDTTALAADAPPPELIMAPKLGRVK